MTEQVVKIKIETPGSLATALATIDQSQYQVVYINITDNNTEGLNDDDIAALGTITTATIDLQDAFYTSEKKAFTFSNSSVQNLILPDNWSKEEVNAVGSTVGTNLGSCLSIGTYEGLKKTDGTNADPSTCTSITAYVNKGNTLFTAMRHIFIDNKPNEKVGFVNNYTWNLSNVKAATISGNPVARDFSGSSDLIDFDANGHIKFSDTYNEMTVYNTDPRTLAGTGTAVEPTFNSTSLAYLDLSDAHILEENSQDLTFSRLNILSDRYRVHLILPTWSGLKTIPAFCLSGINTVKEICIPSNIENIRSYAFPSVDHIWTNATQTDNANTRYDNGIVDLDGNTVTDGEGNDLTGFTDVNFGSGYGGTYTFSTNLKLIESHAFANTEPHVSDVYVLSVKAPECHVDAFNTAMYVANNSYDSSAVQDGIITRAAYTKSREGSKWITMLHYPRECTTPDIQRYTDPTRVYSIATGLRDGKGGIIYFPNQSEYVRAYLQGTYGYVWNAWDPTRDEYGNNSLPNDNDIVGEAAYGYSENGQAIANQLYTNNTYTGVDKTDRTFYDTTNNGSLTKPEGLDDYWTVIWEDSVLYPKAKTAVLTDENGNPVYTTRIVTDENGNVVYDSCSEGDYVRVESQEYVKDDEGEFVKTTVYANTYTATNAPVEGVTAYYDDENGTNSVAPKVGNGYYFEDGTDNVYSDDAVYGPVEGVTTYYTKEGNNYTQTEITFNNAPVYYNPVTEERVKYVETNKIVNGIDTFYLSNDGSDNEVEELTFSDYYGATIYFKDGDTYRETDKFIKGIYTYYASWGYDNYQDATNNLTFTTSVYYKDGTETVTTYSKTNTWIPEVSNYYRETYQGSGVYNLIDLNGGGVFSGTYYYVTGTTPKYSSAAGQDYNSSLTYYSDQQGTVAESITFDTTYYIQDTEEVYVTYDDTHAGEQRYSLETVYSYRLATEEEKADGNTQLYCPRTEEVEVLYVTTANDYRGWHQFVLTGYATNSTLEFEPYRSYITDNDWWTICVPYDLTRAEMVKFFGNDKMTAASDRNPYLSRLLYVVRDAETGIIYLNFSKNLLNYTYAEGTDGHYVQTGEVQSDDEVVLHAGVPYMIRPNIDASANRQFDIYKSTEGTLYNKLQAAQSMSGSDQMQMVLDGIYTVPAYEPAESGTITVANPNDKNDTDYKVNKLNDINYSFVGSFYNSLLPQYAYFLGWNPNTKRATFFYNRAHDTVNWRWANETAIIMANWSSATGSDAIHEATTVKDPARWIVTAVEANNDDFATGGANLQMVFGNDGTTGIVEMADNANDKKASDNRVYNINGQYAGDSLNGLAKGVYIRNGKKVVIK